MSTIPFTVVNSSSVTIFSGTIVVSGSTITNIYSTANPSTDLLIHNLSEYQAVFSNYSPPFWTFNTPTYDSASGYITDTYIVQTADMLYQPTVPMGAGTGTVVAFTFNHSPAPEEQIVALNADNGPVTVTGAPPPNIVVTYTGFGGGGGGGGPACYEKGTRILMGDSTEKSIEEMSVGDIVMTYAHGPKRVVRIGSEVIQNNPKKWYNSLFRHKESGLTVTGGHSILVNSFNPVEQSIVDQIEYPVRQIDGMYALLSTIACSRFEQLQDNDMHVIYHFVVESDNADRQYGVYANGVLSESISLNDFNETLGKKNMSDMISIESEKISCA
jgi:hypothetical protein